MINDYYWQGKREGIILRHEREMKENQQKWQAFRTKCQQYKQMMDEIDKKIDDQLEKCMRLLDEYDRIGKESA